MSAFNPFGRGAFSGSAFGAVTAGAGVPTVAPVLSVSADPSSFVANLIWTPSNRTGSSGFGYDVYVQFNSGGYSLVTTTTGTSYDYDAIDVVGPYDFYVVPKNSAGEGPSSNTASVNLPGESEAAFFYRRPDASSRYLRPDGTSFYVRP